MAEQPPNHASLHLSGALHCHSIADEEALPRRSAWQHSDTPASDDTSTARVTACTGGCAQICTYKRPRCRRPIP